MALKNNNTITVSAQVNTTIKTAWKAWTDPKHICNWNYASDDWHCPKSSNDLRKGGKFSSTMASKEGKISFDFEGVYSKVIEHKLVEYAMSDGRKVRVQFEEIGNQVKVTETFDPEQENSEELQRSGWQAILNNYKKLAESLT